MSDMFELEKLREGLIKAALQAEELRQQLAERNTRIAQLETFVSKVQIELTAFVITNEMGKVIGISFERALGFQKEATVVLDKAPQPAPALKNEDAPLWNCGKDAYLFARGEDYELIIAGDASVGLKDDKHMLRNLDEAKGILLMSGFGERDLVGFPINAPVVTLTSEEIAWLGIYYVPMSNDFHVDSLGIAIAPNCVIRMGETKSGMIRFQLVPEKRTDANIAAIQNRRKELLGE
jgi:hypothetical protein